MKQYDILKPECYNRFSCKGSSCRYNCCSEWRITMSKEEYRRLKKKGVDTDGRICQVSDKAKNESNYCEMVLDENGGCPFLTDEKLCSLQCQFGPGILSRTCTEYPRVYNKYLDKLEGGLSLGCERVLEILLSEKKLTFANYVESFSDNQGYKSNIDAKKRRKYPETVYYYDIQSLCFSIIQAEDATIEDRLILLGIAIHHISELVELGRGREIPEYITHFLNSADEVDATGQLHEIGKEHIGVLYYNLFTAITFSDKSGMHYEELVKKIGKKLKINAFAEINSSSSKTATATVECSMEAYRAGQENFKRFMAGKEHFLENIVIGYILHFNIPFADPENGIWKDYTYMVWVYSMLKFILTMALDENSTDEDMIDCCAILFRKLGHNVHLYKKVIERFEKNDSSTLAHMALFLKS